MFGDNLLHISFVWRFSDCIDKFTIRQCQILLHKEFLKVLKRNSVNFFVSVLMYLYVVSSGSLINLNILFSKLTLFGSFMTIGRSMFERVFWFSWSGLTKLLSCCSLWTLLCRQLWAWAPDSTKDTRHHQ